MTERIIKKFLWHTALGFLLWLIVGKISFMGRVYAGWIAALMGSIYLLCGWLQYLKSKGTDLGRLLRRKKAPDVPYYLRGPQKIIRPHLSLNGNAHTFDDDEEMMQDEDTLPLVQLQRIRAMAWGLTGLCLFILSAF